MAVEADDHLVADRSEGAGGGEGAPASGVGQGVAGPGATPGLAGLHLKGDDVVLVCTQSGLHGDGVAGWRGGWRGGSLARPYIRLEIQRPEGHKKKSVRGFFSESKNECCADSPSVCVPIGISMSLKIADPRRGPQPD